LNSISEELKMKDLRRYQM